MRDNGCTDRGKGQVMKTFEPVALRLRRLAESDRERQRHITVVGSPAALTTIAIGTVWCRSGVAAVRNWWLLLMGSASRRSRGLICCGRVAGVG